MLHQTLTIPIKGSKVVPYLLTYRVFDLNPSAGTERTEPWSRLGPECVSPGLSIPVAVRSVYQRLSRLQLVFSSLIDRL